MRQLTILCIDDDVESLKIRALLLETFGFRVASATRAKDGLRYFRMHPVDAVVMDYQMPEMDGGEAARKMKSLRATVPVMILSALTSIPQEAPRECIDAFVTKGGSTRQLVQSIQQMIDDAPSPAKARMRAARTAGAVMAAVAATVRGFGRPKIPASAKPLAQAPARSH